MPPYARVRVEYARGASWGQLARRYGVDERSLYGFMRRDAEKAGHQWPIRASHARSRQAALVAYDRCEADLLRLELRDFKAWSGVDYTVVAEEAGLNKTTVHKVTSGYKQTVTRETVDKVMAVIYRYEAKRGKSDVA